jgi:acetyl-CoA synthetase
MEKQIQAIAARIAELRQICSKTPEEMAAVTGTSVEYYLASERGENDFSFTFIHNCANVFGVDITELITGDNAKLTTYSIVRSGEGLPLERRRGFKYNHLASYFKGRLSEPFLVRAKYEVGAENRPIPLSRHAGEEFNYVLNGQLKIEVAGNTDILNPGDAIYYNSSEPHGMIALGGDCEFIAVVTDASGKAYDYKGDLIHRDEKQVIVRKYGDFINCEENVDGHLTKIDFVNTERFNFAFDCVDRIAKETPDKLALIHVSADKSERRFTFSDINRLSSQIANYLVSLGVKRGDRIMAVLKRNWQFWPIITAVHKLGAVIIPATNLLMKKDFEYRFKSAGVSTLFCTADGTVADEAELSFESCPEVINRIIVNGSRDGWHCFDSEFTAFSDIYERTSDSACGEDPMLMFFTSGTTGYPKIAIHSFTYPLGHFITAKYWHKVEPDGLHFTISDTGWGKALWGKYYGQWLCGGAVFAYDFDKFSADDILPMFSKYNITTFCAPPTMYRFFIKEDLSKYDMSSLKYATVAGEALNPEVYQRFLEATGIKLMEGFGQTETTLVVANLLGMNPKPGSMGKPSPLFDVDIVDSEGKSVKSGDTGEIVINCRNGMPHGLFCGYYSNDTTDHIDRDRTDAVLFDGLYHTGDLAWRDEDGFLWYVGRSDDIIKSSGYRIGPFEIESVIMELPYVLECAVTAVPDEIRGQIVKATIVPVKGTEVSDTLKKEVQDYVKHHTAPYKYPRIVEFVSELPKTISGKIRRVELRSQAGNN